MQSQKCTKSTVSSLYSRLGRHWKNLTPKTISGYELSWNKWICRYADTYIQDLDMDDWQDIIDEMTNLGYSKSAQHQVRTVVSQIYKMAMGYGFVQTNPAKSLYLEGKSRRETLCFTKSHLRVLKKYADNPDFRYYRACRITLIMCYTGLRPQELFTLPLSAINFKNGYIQWGMKTSAGRNRLIPILPVITDYLIDFMGIQEHEYLLRGPKSERLDMKNWRGREFYPMTLETGLNSLDSLLNKRTVPHFTPYSARHTFATMAKTAGVDSDALIQIMGHTTIQTTNQFYIHKDLEYLQAQANKIEEVIKHDESRV